MVLQLHETGDQDTVTIVLSQSEQQAWLRVLNAAVYVDHICERCHPLNLNRWFLR